MAVCRCQDIKDCEGKMEKLAEALDWYTSDESSKKNIGTNLDMMLTTYAVSFTSEKIKDLCTATKEIDNDLLVARNSIVVKIKRMQEKLRMERDGMKTEDTEFHAEEERKRKESENIQQIS